MKFEKYVEGLNKMLKENPEYKDLTVINSIDSEGNGFNEVYYYASEGSFVDGDFVAIEQFAEYDMDNTDLNAICIN